MLLFVLVLLLVEPSFALVVGDVRLWVLYTRPFRFFFADVSTAREADIFRAFRIGE